MRRGLRQVLAEDGEVIFRQEEAQPYFAGMMQDDSQLLPGTERPLVKPQTQAAFVLTEVDSREVQFDYGALMS
jgi:hypothetical protein